LEGTQSSHVMQRLHKAMKLSGRKKYNLDY
jgi:hypothetical protein